MSKSNDVFKQILRATRRKFSADDKIRIVLEGLRGQIAISELCRREGIAASMYCKWSKAFLGTGKNGLTRDTLRDAILEKRAELKAEKVLERKKVNSRIVETEPKSSLNKKANVSQSF